MTWRPSNHYPWLSQIGRHRKVRITSKYWLICSFADECLYVDCFHKYPHLDRHRMGANRHQGIKCTQSYEFHHKVGCRRVGKLERGLRLI